MDGITVRRVANGYIVEESGGQDCATTPDGTHVFESIDDLNKWLFVNFNLKDDKS